MKALEYREIDSVVIYTFCGTICFDNSEKIAYEKLLHNS